MRNLVKLLEKQFSAFAGKWSLKIRRKLWKWPYICSRRCAIFWNGCDTNFHRFAIFSFWDMFDFVLKLLRKLNHKWPNYWVLPRFCSRLNQNAFQKKISTKNCCNFFFDKIFFCIKSSEKYTKKCLWKSEHKNNMLWRLITYLNEWTLMFP